MNDRVFPPDDNSILDDFKREIFRDMNVMKIGEIQSYDPSTASATVKIKIKEWTDFEHNQSASYPVLSDVPVFILQGGGSWIEFPISKGDPCLVFFSDRDIDTWWTSGNETTPNSLRKHDLSDCIAVVGLNPKANPLALTGKLRIFGGSKKMDLANSAQALSSLMATMFSNIDSLFVQVDGLISDLESLVTTNCAVGSPVSLSPATIAALTTRSGSFDSVKANFDTLKTNFTQLLGVSS